MSYARQCTANSEFSIGCILLLELIGLWIFRILNWISWFLETLQYMGLFLLGIPLKATFRTHSEPQQWKTVELSGWKRKKTVCALIWMFSEALDFKDLDSKRNFIPCVTQYTSKYSQGPSSQSGKRPRWSSPFKYCDFVLLIHSFSCVSLWPQLHYSLGIESAMVSRITRNKSATQGNCGRTEVFQLPYIM